MNGRNPRQGLAELVASDFPALQSTPASAFLVSSTCEEKKLKIGIHLI